MINEITFFGSIDGTLVIVYEDPEFMNDKRISDLVTAVGKTKFEVLQFLNGVIPDDEQTEATSRRLVHHFQQQNNLAYPEDVLADDVELIKRLLPTKADREVENTLKTVGYAKHRVSIAMRFLCADNTPKVDRKRANTFQEPCEEVEPKLCKLADSSVPQPEMNANSRIPKLVLKKDGGLYQIEEPRPSGWLSKKVCTSTITRPPDDDVPSSSTCFFEPPVYRPTQQDVRPFPGQERLTPITEAREPPRFKPPCTNNLPGSSQATSLKVPFTLNAPGGSVPRKPMNPASSLRSPFAGNVPGGTSMHLNDRFSHNSLTETWWQPPIKETTTNRHQSTATSTDDPMDNSVIVLDNSQEDDDIPLEKDDMIMDGPNDQPTDMNIFNIQQIMNGENNSTDDKARALFDLNDEVQKALLDSPASSQSSSTIYQSPMDDYFSDNDYDDDIPAPSSLVIPACSKATTSKAVDEKLVHKLLEMFPQADPNYIRQICGGKLWSESEFDQLVDVMLGNENYPRRPEREPSPDHEIDPQEQLNILKSVLPDADPTYLERKLDEMGGDAEAFGNFISEAVESKNYPTMKEYLRKQQLSAQQRQYTTEFNVKRFVELFPEPISVFENKGKKSCISDAVDRYLVKWFLRTKYPQLYASDINSVMTTQQTLVSMITSLDSCSSLKKTKTSVGPRPECQNVPLLQEMAYFEHKIEILKFIEEKKVQEEKERENAKELGLLQTCACCFDDEVMPKDIYTCLGGCRFCKDCIRRSSEVAVGDGKTDFRCLAGECNKEFSLQVLQSVLPPKMFSKIAQKKALVEVKAAGIEELETCPFCDFANIPAPEDKLFRCLNPECMKESCRLCKEPSHVPLRCEEVEKDEDVKARVYIENKMTEALVRQCWKCNAKFIKEEGCNKMTCSCGAMMCYICRQPVKDYTHFNGQGGDRFDLCPLYSENFSVNEKNVLKAAEEAKKEVDPSKLKHDPTADLNTHFAPKMKRSHMLREAIQNLDRGLPLPRNLPDNNGYIYVPDIRIANQRLIHYENIVRVRRNYHVVVDQNQPQHQPPHHHHQVPQHHRIHQEHRPVEALLNQRLGNHMPQPQPPNPNNNHPQYDARYH